MYHFSAPMASWKPSDELSDPRLLLCDAPGMGKAFAVGDVERWYGGACCLVGWKWFVACTVVGLAPGEGDRVFVVIVRVDVVASRVVLCTTEAVCALAAFCRAGWARKAARKPPKKGLFVDMVFVGVAGRGEGCCRSWCISRCSSTSASHSFAHRFQNCYPVLVVPSSDVWLRGREDGGFVSRGYGRRGCVCV
jgi:hypothetical protein